MEREANACADFLAKSGVEGASTPHMLYVVSQGLYPFLSPDFVGTFVRMG